MIPTKDILRLPYFLSNVGQTKRMTAIITIVSTK